MQLTSKEMEEDKFRKEIHRLTTQLSFKDQELKETESRYIANQHELQKALSAPPPPAQQPPQDSTEKTPVTSTTNNRKNSGDPTSSSKTNSGGTLKRTAAKPPENPHESKKQKVVVKDADISKENDVLRRNVSQLKNRLKVVKKALNGDYDHETKPDTSGIRDELSEVLKRELDRFHKEFVHSSVRGGTEDTEIKKLQEQVTTLEKLKEEHLVLFTESQAQITELQKEKQEAQDRIKSLIVENESQRKEIIELFNKICGNQQHIDRLQKEQVELEHQVAQHERNCALLQEKYNALQHQHSSPLQPTKPSPQQEEPKMSQEVK